MTHPLRAIGLALLCSALPLAAGAQEAPPADTMGRAPTLRGVHVATRSRGTAVATAIVIPVGSAADPSEGPGTAHTLGEVLAAGVRRSLGPAAEVSVRVERDWTAFLLLAPREGWPASLEALASSLFRDPVPGDLVEAVRNGLLARFTFEEGAPVREFQRELYGVLTSAADPWARGPRGRAEAVRGLSPGDLASFRRTHYDRGTARVVVVGPVDTVAARAAVAAAGLGGRPTPRPGADDDRAWDEGERLHLAREVTNAWIGVLFPAPGDMSRTLLEALAHRVTEELNPATPDPGIYAASARVEETPGGPVLLIEAAVFPEAAQRWERRILEMVDELEEPAAAPFFRWQRRRFRSERLLEESPPEAEALRAALDLLREGRVRDLPAEVWSLTADAIAGAADELGDPRILVLGPDLAEGSR